MKRGTLLHARSARVVRSLACAGLLLAPAACGRGREAPAAPEMDLAAMLYQSERRPEGAPFEIVPAALDGRVRRAIRTPAVGRISWKVKLPARAVLQTYIRADPECPASGKGVLFRIGISDGRTYDELLNRWVGSAGDRSGQDWQPILIDLSPYSGFKWSLFYHPSRIWWWIVFNTAASPASAQPACAPRPLWGAPAIVAADAGHPQ